MPEPTSVERATKLVEHTAAQLKRVTDFGPYEGKGKAVAAIRRELKQAEKALAAAKAAEANVAEAKAAEAKTNSKVEAPASSAADPAAKASAK